MIEERYFLPNFSTPNLEVIAWLNAPLKPKRWVDKDVEYEIVLNKLEFHPQPLGHDKKKAWMKTIKNKKFTLTM